MTHSVTTDKKRIVHTKRQVSEQRVIERNYKMCQSLVLMVVTLDYTIHVISGTHEAHIDNLIGSFESCETTTPRLNYMNGIN